MAVVRGALCGQGRAGDADPCARPGARAGVRVCGIAPGPVAIEPEQEERRAASTLLGRIGSPDDIADAVLYLAGATYVTGTTLFVDGGQSLQTRTRPDP